MTTDDYNSLRILSDNQNVAIDALIGGATHAEAAERAGVHRVTVSKWVARHPGFRAELNRRRAELGEQRVARLRELDELALDAAASRLETLDPEFAMKWLKFRGLNATVLPSPGPTDPGQMIERFVEGEAREVRSHDFDIPIIGFDRDRCLAELEAELDASVDSAESSQTAKSAP